MLMLRRMLVLWMLMIWQGGFVFYGLVVIHVGLQVLGSSLQQAWITQRVTNWLNLIGALALAAWAWDIAAESAPSRLRRRRWLLWGVLVMTLAALAMLHPLLDRHMDYEQSHFSDAPSFHELHRWYLRVSTAQWVGAFVLSALTLRTWRQRDPLESGGTVDGTNKL